MKIIRIILFALLIISNVPGVLANTPPPPAPTAKNASTNATLDDDTPPPPGLPINEDLPFLIGAGLILGMTIIYRNRIKKASM
ncbi:hypothetical protein ASE21_08295 [Flavobacterium sp. Root901]|uniref:hypothetical protein n=1 Tax=Flavobacterium sp. Root901 TaxID=1736605 RepID=UPI000710B8F8|nr:hypothetical protein [Flavobacterium sp. Root901]KRD11689.1 hypothetical protein ASE21_08295 [Flavobacterium sp. Root901]